MFASQEKHPYVGGEFVWTGWDYLGEPTPFDSSRSSYSGIIDLAGFKKDRFYLYQAHWRPDFPMAHILPHWTWPERVGQVTPVHVFTSGDEGGIVPQRQIAGPQKERRVRISPALGRRRVSAGHAQSGRLQERQNMGDRRNENRRRTRADSNWNRIATRFARMERICRS